MVSRSHRTITDCIVCIIIDAYQSENMPRGRNAAGNWLAAATRSN